MRRVRRLFACTAALACAACAGERRAELRVCADPNNLPFSNQREEGLENRLAEVLADEIDADVRYTWWPQRRAFLRNTLRAGTCDVVLGVPASYELVLRTRPYYRSTYVFVLPRERSFDVTSLDDEVLRRLRIGVHVMGDDFANSPPSHALAGRGIIENVRGFRIYGDYSEPDPPARILDALAVGDIDVAIVWGPLAGFFAPRLDRAVDIVAVSPQIDLPFLPFVYDIAIGVRHEDTLLHRRLDEALVARRADVARILADYNVPRVGGGTVSATSGPIHE